MKPTLTATSRAFSDYIGNYWNFISPEKICYQIMTIHNLQLKKQKRCKNIIFQNGNVRTNGELILKTIDQNRWPMTMIASSHYITTHPLLERKKNKHICHDDVSWENKSNRKQSDNVFTFQQFFCYLSLEANKCPK